MSIKAILFDLDGVLVSAKDWHYAALNKALAVVDKKYVISHEEHLLEYDGNPTKKKLEILTKNKGFPVEKYELIAALKQKYTIEQIEDKCAPQENIETCVKTLYDIGYKIAVCSNSVRNSIVLMLTKSNIIDYFDLIVSNEDVKLPKPNPEMYLKAVQQFGFESNSCLIVEDSSVGIQAAIASGCNYWKINEPADITIETLFAEIMKHNETV